MKTLLEKLASEITTCTATVTVVPIPKGNGVPWVKLVLVLESLDKLFKRPLLSVLAPPTRFPVVVEYHHADPQKTTGYRYEFGVDPNDPELHKRTNPPTIDNLAELETLCRALLGTDETKLTVSRMS